MRKYLYQLVESRSEHKKVWREKKKKSSDLGLFLYTRKNQEKYTEIIMGFFPQYVVL